MSRTLAAVFMLGLLAACGSDTPSEKAEAPVLYSYSSLVEAMAEARSTVDVFWAARDAAAAETSDFALKVPMESEDYVTDYIWVLDPVADGMGGVTATIAPETEVDITGFSVGDAYRFLESDIVDWRYSEAGRTRGAYTSRAMLDLSPNADVDALRDLFHESPVP